MIIITATIVYLSGILVRERLLGDTMVQQRIACVCCREIKLKRIRPWHRLDQVENIPSSFGQLLVFYGLLPDIKQP